MTSMLAHKANAGLYSRSRERVRGLRRGLPWAEAYISRHPTRGLVPSPSARALPAPTPTTSDKRHDVNSRFVP